MQATFRSGRNLAIAAAALLAITAVVEFTLGIAWLTFEPTWRGSNLAEMVLSLLETTSGLVWIATAVLFSTWVYRATANLPALGAVATRFTPAAAVWAFFIPFVNLVRGHQVMAMIWNESQPRPLTFAGFLKARSIPLVNWWWGLWIGSRVMGWIGELVSDVDGEPTWRGVLLVPSAVAAILCLVMVLKADERQREQAIDLERRAGVPRPTGMALR
jgi:hypothetical protein